MARSTTSIHISKQRAAHLFVESTNFIRQQIPGFRWGYKSDSKVQRLIGFLLRWVLPINRKYMTRYTSTFYPRVWFPDGLVERNPWQATKILWHEYVHLVDCRDDGKITFSWLYLMWWSLLVPVAIGTAAAFIVVGMPWWSYLFLALAVLPYPSRWRRDYEMRGYAMNMVINAWKYGSIRNETKEFIVGQFTGPAYAWMWPFRKSMQERVLSIEGKITFGSIGDGRAGEPYHDAIAVLGAGTTGRDAA